ncbi:hypothetical protein P8452_45634 [Trifolium repens]|nr:hypothetical protein P8452_45634 [Trifolium repens]
MVKESEEVRICGRRRYADAGFFTFTCFCRNSRQATASPLTPVTTALSPSLSVYEVTFSSLSLSETKGEKHNPIRKNQNSKH